MNRGFRSTIGALAVLLSFAIAAQSSAAELWRAGHVRHIVYAPVIYGPAEPLCFWCIRDAIYADTKRIAHLEANPNVDDADKAPWILGARADIHHLRRILGPVAFVSPAPCCYWRKRMYVR
jgi:hypothetical protein